MCMRRLLCSSPSSSSAGLVASATGGCRYASSSSGGSGGGLDLLALLRQKGHHGVAKGSGSAADSSNAPKFRKEDLLPQTRDRPLTSTPLQQQVMAQTGAPALKRIGTAYLDELEEEQQLQAEDASAANADLLTMPGLNIGEEMIREHTLLDDSHSYFPPLATSAEKGGTFAAEDGQQAAQKATQQQLHVPGSELLSPGLTRYRVDVQYQGSDFAGWQGTTERSTVTRTKDGNVLTKTASDDSKLNSDGLAEAVTKPRAKNVVEDALAVALDVDNVRVEASVLPLSGVHVRRLPCHVDLPSSIAMQPRTVVQRAMMWLQKKQLPLAITAFERCDLSSTSAAAISGATAVAPIGDRMAAAARKKQKSAEKKNTSPRKIFNARHAATRRVYLYRILNRIAPPLFDAGLQWHVDRALDVDRMNAVAQMLEGRHDFAAFCDPRVVRSLISQSKSSAGVGRPEKTSLSKHPYLQVDRKADEFYTREYKEQNQRIRQSLTPNTPSNEQTVRTLERCTVVRQDDEVQVWFAARSFLREQILGIVAVLKMVGQGKWGEKEVRFYMERGFASTSGTLIEGSGGGLSLRQAKQLRPEPAPRYGLTLWDVEFVADRDVPVEPYLDSGPLEELATPPSSSSSHQCVQMQEQQAEKFEDAVASEYGGVIADYGADADEPILAESAGDHTPPAPLHHRDIDDIGDGQPQVVDEYDEDGNELLDDASELAYLTAERATKTAAAEKAKEMAQQSEKFEAAVASEYGGVVADYGADADETILAESAGDRTPPAPYHRRIDDGDVQPQVVDEYDEDGNELLDDASELAYLIAERATKTAAAEKAKEMAATPPGSSSSRQ